MGITLQSSLLHKGLCYFKLFLTMMKMILVLAFFVAVAQASAPSAADIAAAEHKFCEDVAHGNTEAAMAVVEKAIAFQCSGAGNADMCKKLHANKATGLSAVAAVLGC